MKRVLLILLLLGGAVSALGAQVVPRPRPSPRPPARGSGVGADSLSGRDTSVKSDTTVQWSEPDSVMRRLMELPGYAQTRYEGTVVTFDALNRAFGVAVSGGKRAAIRRGQDLIVTDSAIVFNDSTRVVQVSGAKFVIAEGGSGQAPIVGSGSATYNLAERSGRITNPVLTIDNGQRWYIKADIGKPVLGDSLTPSRFYGRGGSMTSCDDSIPDYHFAMKEIKRTDRTLVARPAVLYIRDVPVLWLPFIFQDIRSGRRSGMLPPRFGFSDIVRSNSNYRRNVENVGWYFATSDYSDAQLWLDWRSSAGGAVGDPGWVRFNGEWRYRWLNRFLTGGLATSYTSQRDGTTNTAVSWNHQQSFSRNSQLTSRINYVTSTRLQRQTTFNPYAVLATISSEVNYQQKIGAANFTLGGTRKQYPGRDQVDQTIPTVSLTSGPVSVGKWLTWTPSFNYTATQSLKIDQPGLFAYRYVRNAAGTLDSVQAKKNTYSSQASFDTPISLFGWSLRNSFRISSQRNEFPEQYTITDVRDTSKKETRIFASTYRTDVDWTPTFELPAFARDLFKVSPSIGFTNVDPGPFWVRTQLSGGRFVHQTKRPSFGLSASPAIYGLFPGFGPFERIRHTILPTISYSYAPKAEVSDDYLQAVGRTRVGYLGSLRQNAVSLGFSQNFEAKVKKPTGDTSGTDQSEKIKLLSLNFSSLSYDFERAHATKRALAGVTTDNFEYNVRSDLLPGFDFSMGYSLFQGSTLSDTAVFKPYRERVSASFQVGQKNNPFAIFSRLFGRAVPDAAKSVQGTSTLRPSADDRMAQQIASQPVAGSGSRNAQFLVPTDREWRASFTFSSSHPRPPVGGTIIEYDPRVRCEPFRALNQLQYEFCLAQQATSPTADQPITNTALGGPVYRQPATTSFGSNLNFGLTQHWSAGWNTNYDVQRHQFASNMVSLQRDLHDWRAVFAFTQSPNGNFAFNFFISLKAEPDLKFDYNRATVRNQGTSFLP
ncbi:MAG: hypothetical protein JWO05_2058 [Gemmatimonadetes bacterium]|nr:hypothetical protein [Gemmatimonadota bacterium]